MRASRSVGAIPQTSKFQLNQGEISEVFSLPLTAFANPRLVEEQEVLINGVPATSSPTTSATAGSEG